MTQKKPELPLSEQSNRNAILSEEIVSITRGGNDKPSLYDVTFNSNEDIVFDGEIVSDKQSVSYPQFFQNKLNKNPKLGSLVSRVPEPEVLFFLKSVPKKDLFQLATSGQQVANRLNTLLGDKIWQRTLNWGSGNRIGQGETMLQLAFASDGSVEEPDWVSQGGSLKFSVKKTDGSADVLSGQQNSDMVTHINNFWEVLGVPPATGLTPPALEEILLGMSDRERTATAKRCEELLLNMKKSFTKEHGANGVLFLIRGTFFYVNSEGKDPKQLSVYAIQGNRIKIFDPTNSTRNSLDKVIEKSL
jgi:hypothetical protein